MMSLSPDSSAPSGRRGRARPPLLRALGSAHPPAWIEITGRRYDCREILKHDAWACTVLYEGAAGRVACKFNRQQPILGLPMKWCGQWLARRERRMLQRLVDVPEIPQDAGDITVDGVPLPHAAAHVFVEGHPLARGEHVGDGFFPRLVEVLSDIHARDMALVDLNKRQNIIVGLDGRPYLIDFQISFMLPDRWPGIKVPMRALLRILQRADAYHLYKHFAKHRPDQLGPEQTERLTRRPWAIRAWRCISTPYQFLRRRMLVLIGVRKGEGLAITECDPEDAVRSEQAQQAP